MPIYEYQCQGCGHELEKLQKMSEPPLSDCPQCDEPALIKQVSAAGFRLKGTGWYATDFKTKKNQDTDSSAKKSAAKTNTSQD